MDYNNKKISNSLMDKMRGLHTLVFCTFSFVAGAAVDIYIDSPVTLSDCRSPRQEDQWTIGTTEATTKITEKPADPREFYDAASDGDLQYIEDEVSRLGASGLNLDWRNPDDYERTALHVASIKNKPSIVSALLTAGANPNVQDYRGRTPVHIAATDDKIDVLRLLLDPKYKADVKLADNAGWTLVYRAAYYGSTAALELLLAQGRGDPNTVDNRGISPLMTASLRGHTACVRALLAAGAHVNYVRPRDGRTALHLATWYSMADVALVLLESGATKDTEDNDGETPADEARLSGHHSLADLIDSY